MIRYLLILNQLPEWHEISNHWCLSNEQREIFQIFHCVNVEWLGAFDHRFSQAFNSRRFASRHCGQQAEYSEKLLANFPYRGFAQKILLLLAIVVGHVGQYYVVVKCGLCQTVVRLELLRLIAHFRHRYHGEFFQRITFFSNVIV